MNFHTQNFYLYEGFAPLIWHGIVNAVAMGGIAFAFTGFHHDVELAAETENSNDAITLSFKWCSLGSS
ncbi:hypothetical protein [Coxiella-like endosymbiont]|uniref:hypothetical protein n=1 Tax=Coxiella-like endosymbiont TaxID=1592897 RepID=UPI00272983BE|nr:hypothetical protein [Coxiella-like endosymbiont]